MSRQFAVFAVVGLATAVVDVGLFYLLVRSGTGTVVAATVSFVAALLLNFALHLRITFSTSWSSRSMWRYAVVVAFNYGVTLLMVKISESMLTDPLPGKIASVPVVAAIGFLLSKHWVFK